MKFSESKWCVPVVLMGLILFGMHTRATAALPPSNNKVIIYPAATETIDQLTQKGITKVWNYGSYWLVQATDAQVDELTRMYGARAVTANDLNHIRLRNLSFDTTEGDPVVPANLRQQDQPGKRLRLIQFRGPVIPQWLQQVESVGGVDVISYVPNNAYLIRLDQAAEDKLRTLEGLGGPVQWMGPYHPYYKIHPGLVNSDHGDEDPLVDVHIIVVRDSETNLTMRAMEKLGLIQESHNNGNESALQMTVPLSTISQIAKLTDVVWIEKKEPKRILDEVQDLVLAGQTNAPGFGPTNMLGNTSAMFTNYLDFLFTQVAGTQTNAFMDPTTYPMVDCWDTGLDDGGLGVSFDVAHPCFYYLGNKNSFSRVVYLAPPWIAGDPTVQLGCTTRISEKQPPGFRYVECADLSPDSHGTMVASIVAGFDDGTNVYDKPCLELVSATNTWEISIVANSQADNICNTNNGFCFSTNGVNCGILNDLQLASSNVTYRLPTGFLNTCGPSNGAPPTETFTNALVTVTTNSCPTNIFVDVLYTEIVTNYYFDFRTDMSGFHLGMGVSPFGLLGADRIMTQDLNTFTVVGSECTFLYSPIGVCLNDYPSAIAEDYEGTQGYGARIQNNSWADILSTTGLNGGQYDADCVTFDIAVRDALLVGSSNNTPGPSPLNQELIEVFACNSLLGDAGNQGNAGGFADIRVTSPATAKNVISVGSSVNPRLTNDFYGPNCEGQTNSLDMYSSSAAGPTLDRRFKPEIVAPGASVYGALSQIFPDRVTSTNCSEDDLVPAYPYIQQCTNPPCSGNEPFYSDLYVCNSGSSFAAPAVSGGIQLLWWYFQHRLTNELGQALYQPSPAMAKAYVCNSARYLPIADPQNTNTLDTLPSILQGMGALDLQTMFDGVPRAIRDESSPRALDVPLTTTNPAPQQTYFSQSGQTYSFSGQIVSNGLPFRVTLAWTDAPGVPFVTPELVNSLGLEVTIGGVTYYGNVFAQNVSVPGGTFDTVNNMQSVFLNPVGWLGGISAVTAGAPWQVTVRASNIAGRGVPNVGEPSLGGSNVLNQDFALVVYNADTITVSDVPNPATNNDCSTALDITSYPFTFTNTLTNATYHQPFPSPTAGNGGPEEFFRIPLPTPGATIEVDTFGSSFDTVLSVWEVQVVPQTVFIRGECGALTEVVSTNHANASTLQSQLTFTSDGSNDYFIVVAPHNNGPGGTMVLNVSASAVPITLTPTSLNFGNQIVGTTSTNQVVVYENGTTVPVTITNLSITGAASNDFVIVSQNCNDDTIGSGGNCSVQVAFAPTTNGTRQANLLFTDTAVGSPRLVSLTGNGTPPAPAVCLSTGPSFTFSNQFVGTTSAAQSVVITNCGSKSLTVYGATFSGTGSGDFSVAPTACTNAPIAAGGTCTLELTFTPSEGGTRLATLVIPNSSVDSPATVTVQGYGEPQAASVCLSSSSINFGSVAVNTTGSLQNLTITSCGTAPLVISSIAPTAGNTGDFIVVSDPCTTGPISISNTCVVGLEFTPTSGGLRSATLSISNNAGSPQLVTLSGMGAMSQPDAAIGKNTTLKKMVGFGIINTTGIRQEISQNVHLEKPKAIDNGKGGVSFYVALKNIGAEPDQFLVEGQQIDGGSGFTANYFLGSKPSDSIEVTAAVVAGTFATTTMEAGAVTGDSTMIRVVIQADKTIVAKGTTATFTLTFTSVSDSTKKDTVRATVVAK
ncbi:MAG: choice-of-anchor D domain-containing protein [Verrucomicrobiia bacterium]